MYKIIILLFAFPISILYSQNNTPESNSTDSTKSKEFSEWDLDYWGMNSFNDLKRPTIELEYGKNKSYYNKDVLSNQFEENYRFFGKIGFANYGETVAESGLLKYKFGSLFFGQSLGEIEEIGKNESLNSKVLSIGLMSSDGYGYTLSENFFLLFTHAGGLSWNSLDFTNPEGLVDSNQIDRILVLDDGIRFGELFEAGVKLRVIENLGLTATYSENLIMPRFLFWYWSLGKIIEGTSQGIASYFIDRVKTTSPELVPIIYFIVKNGISYGFNRLREKNMNWPSSTAPPLFERNFNIGISLIF